MQLTLYRLTGCDDFKIDKSSYITSVIALNGDIKEDCDISSPVITCECPKTQTNENIIDFNYCRISELNRYYFIDKIVFGMNNIITIYCTSDVLYSFKDRPDGVTSHWYYNYLYCTRKTNGNDFIQDNERPYQYNKQVSDITSFIPIPEGTPRVNFQTSGWYDTSYRVIISVINQTTWQGKKDNLAFLDKASLGKLPTLTNLTSGKELASNYYLITMRSLATIIDACIGNDEIVSFIKSVIVLPYTPEYTTDWPYITPEGEEPSHTRNLLWGTGGTHVIQLPDDIGFPLYSNYDRFIKEYRDVPSASSYLDYAPYKQLKMYIPYKDTIELNLESVSGCRLALLYYVDYDDGMSNVILYNVTKGIVEYQSTCQLGVKIGISSSNELEINNQKIQLGITTAISTIASILALASGNPLIAGGGVLGLVGGSAKAFTQANSMLVMGEHAISSGNVGVLNNQNVQFIQTKIIPIFATGNTDYIKDKGVPYNNYLAINDATDDEYLVFDDDNIPMDNRMTKQEFNTLVGLLKKGVRK